MQLHTLFRELYHAMDMCGDSLISATCVSVTPDVRSQMEQEHRVPGQSTGGVREREPSREDIRSAGEHGFPLHNLDNTARSQASQKA